MSGIVESDSWLYLDTLSGNQKGPVPTRILLKLVEKGIVTNTILWKNGMEKWLPLNEVEPFAKLVKFQSKQWYYLDSENNQKGPVFSRFLLHKVKEGEVDGFTLVYGGDLTEWKKISEVGELKEAIQAAAEEEQAYEEAKKAAKEAAITEDIQVFDSSLPPSEGKVTSVEAGKKDSTKAFLADDGSKYRWDDEEQDWVVDEEEEEEEDQDMHDDEDSENGDIRSRKRRANDDEDDEASEGEDNNNEQLLPSASDESKGGEESAKPKKRRSKKKKHKGPNTWVYVTGLPADVTAEEIKEHFSKMGLIAISPYDQQPRIKIYREEQDPTRCKGDGLICYNSEESVKLACDILHEGYIRPKYQISVTRASFESAQENNQSAKSTGSSSSSRPKPALSQAQVKVARNAAKQALAWNEDDDSGINRSNALRIVVLEGMFAPQDFHRDPSLAQELEKDIAMECERFGTIEKITLFSKNPRGIVIVKFATSFAAQECIQVMNGRFFDKRKIKSYFWDGVTNYSIVPTSIDQEDEEEKEEKARLDEFGDWLEQDQDELPDELQLRTE